MPRSAPLKNDFSSGELSPRLKGRMEADKYREAAATLKNYIPFPQGPITRRPGSVYVNEIKTSSEGARLIPFVFSATVAYQLEFGNNYIRFYKDNAQLLDGGAYEISTPYDEEEVLDLSYAQNGDIMYLAHQSFRLRKLTRLGDIEWTLEEVDYDEPNYLPFNSLSAGAQTEAVKTATLTPAATTGNTNVTMGPDQTITAIADDGAGNTNLTIPNHGFVDGDSIGVDGGNKILLDRMVTLDADTDNRVVDSNTIKISPSFPGAGYDGSGFVYPDIYPGAGVYVRLLQGSTWGWAEVNDRGIVVGHLQTFNVTVVSAFGSTATAGVWRFGDTSNPGLVTFHEDRLVLSKYADQPQRTDLSETGNYEDFSPTTAAGAVIDSGGISFSLASNDVNAIQNIISGPKGLFIGTFGGEWIVRPSSQGEALTPTNVNAKRSTTSGSSSATPVQVGNAVIFVQKTGKKIRDSIYSFQSDGFRSNDLTFISEHITKNGVTALALQREPIPTVWAIRSDGALLGLGYERLDDQAVKFGIHRHEIGGAGDSDGNIAEVESISVIPAADGKSDELWMIVKRYIDGDTVRYIEYLSKLYEDTDSAEDVKDGIDSVVTFTSGTATTSVTGLSHLEGEEVSVWADGAAQNPKTVASGAIELDTAASKVQVGLAYDSDVETLRFESGSANGTALGKTQRINRVGILLHKTINMEWGPDFSDLVPIIFRNASDPLGEAVPLFSGIKSETFDSDYDFENNICIRQSGPGPGTVLAIMPQMATEDR